MSPIVTPQSGGRDRRHELLPRELWPCFDDRFVGSCDLIEEFTVALTVEVLERCELAASFQQWTTIADVIPGSHVVREYASEPLDWMLRLLCDHGLAERSLDAGRARYRRTRSWTTRDRRELLLRQAALDPAALPAFRLAQTAAEGYPAFLRGEARGDEILFAAAAVELWSEYFSNQNPLYGISNRVAAAAVVHWQRGALGRVVELGGGMGSAALALLEQLETAGRTATLQGYCFSDASPLFLRRGQRSLSSRFPPSVAASFRRVDIDLPLAPQGLGPASADLIYAVNVLHVARDLDATLAELHRTLAPGGWLVLGECLRPTRERALYTEFVFLLLDSFRTPRLDPIARPTGGFLRPEEWRVLLSRNGFARVDTYPDLARVVEVYPAFVVGAIGAQRTDG